MTPLEQEIIKALRETEQGKEFVKEWVWKSGEYGYHDRKGLCKFQTADEKVDNFYDDDFSDFVPILTESQMLDAIEKFGYEIRIFINIEDKYMCWVYKLISKVEHKTKGKTCLEAVQQAFLSVVLGGGGGT